ncbi:MAG: hypothetical protein WCU00_01980 [Candidatus Latescibacterota bacterium]
MKIHLTKSQINDLFRIMGKCSKEETELYRDLKSLIKLSPRVNLEKQFELDLSEEDIIMVRDMLTRPEKEITGENIFSEMTKGMKKHL